MAKGRGNTRTKSTGGGSTNVKELLTDYFYKTANYVYSDDSVKFEQIISLSVDKKLSDSTHLVVNATTDSRSGQYPNEPEYDTYKLKINRKTKEITQI